MLNQLGPPTARLLRTTTLMLFCMPIVVAAPILGIALKGSGPQIALAALLVFFPTLLSTHLGLGQAPGDAVQVVRAAGGGRIRQLLLVRLRAAVPDMLAGLQIAAPAAVLGAMLGEFLGNRWGLGIYLIGSMGRADPAVVWAIGLTATVLSVALYALVGLIRIIGRIERTQPAMDLAPTAPTSGGRLRGLATSTGWFVAGLVVLLALWELFIAATGLPRTLMNGPQEVFRRLFVSSAAESTRERVLAALGESLQAAVVGVVAGIVVAFVLAVLFSTFRDVGRIAMPFAFISQTVPLVALAPLIALVLGRGFTTTVAVTISVTFFPSLVTIMEGIARAPSGPLDVLRSVNASKWIVLTRVTLPNAVPYLLASVRLAVPRALTGVLIAEQYITGAGLGGLLGSARGTLDYGLMWVITVVVAVFSIIAYGLAHALESAVLRRRA